MSDPVLADALRAAYAAIGDVYGSELSVSETKRRLLTAIKEVEAICKTHESDEIYPDPQWIVASALWAHLTSADLDEVDPHSVGGGWIVAFGNVSAALLAKSMASMQLEDDTELGGWGSEYATDALAMLDKENP
jgi:hypothetical protein